MMNKTELKTKELKELMKEKLEELKMGEVELVAGGVDIDAAVKHLVSCRTGNVQRSIRALSLPLM